MNWVSLVHLLVDSFKNSSLKYDFLLPKLCWLFLKTLNLSTCSILWSHEKAKKMLQETAVNCISVKLVFQNKSSFCSDILQTRNGIFQTEKWKLDKIVSLLRKKTLRQIQLHHYEAKTSTYRNGFCWKVKHVVKFLEYILTWLSFSMCATKRGKRWARAESFSVLTCLTIDRSNASPS